jgi:hypothetical protein
MARCPDCGVSSREDPGAMVVTDEWRAKPLGTFSVSGSQMKTVVVVTHRLSCVRCGWSILGRIVGEEFIADPRDQTTAKEAHADPDQGDGAD